MAALAVVLIACPCAMGLAVPAAVFAACSRSATLGIILRGGDVIERLARINMVLLDKTGTITMGTPRVVSFSPREGFEVHDLLRCIASVEEHAAHPLARSIVAYAAEQGECPGDCRVFELFPGKGVCGVTADNRKVLCGSARLFQEQGLALSEDDFETVQDTVVWVAMDRTVAGRFLLRDQIRHGSDSLVRSFVDQKVEVSIVSGDAQQVVDCIAGQIGVAVGRGDFTPDRKLELLKGLQGQGGRILMVGDGVNDAPALAAADVSCTLTGSSDIALENADVIITSDDLSRLATAYRIAVATMVIIKQNLAWAFLYNLIGIPLAVCGVLTPVYAAVAMTASSLLVSLNSLRLMRITHNG
jgi:Cu2+-exporting ATPase